MENNGVHDVTLETLGGGAAAVRFQRELQKVLENIRDPNTDWKDVREITVKLKVKAKDEYREKLTTRVAVSSKLAPAKAVETEVYLGERDGQLTAVNFDLRQADLFRSQADNKVAPINSKREAAQ